MPKQLMGKDPMVHIIIVNYLKWEDTLACLESVSRSTFQDFRIYVIDNCSPNDSFEKLLEWGHGKDFRSFSPDMFQKTELSGLPGFCLIRNESNAGFAAANNIVLRRISAIHGYAWLLNPDMMVELETLSELVICCSQNDPHVIAGARIYNYHNRRLICLAGGRVNFNTAGVRNIKTDRASPSPDYISGACLFTRTENFRHFGLLPEEYFLYWEETDWCFGAKMKGAQLRLCDSSICYDRISTVIGKGFLAHYYYTRNGLLFISKYKNEKLKRAVFSMYLRIIKRMLLFQWSVAKAIRKAITDFKKGKFHAIQ